MIAHDRGAVDVSVLLYGQYDVHPVDPIAAWRTDPFVPFIETQPNGDRLIRARGASDAKGQLMTFIEACRAWKEVTGRLPISVTVVIEGEAQIGTASLAQFLTGYACELRADIGLICNATMREPATPAIGFTGSDAPPDGLAHGPACRPLPADPARSSQQAFLCACDALSAEWGKLACQPVVAGPLAVADCLRQSLGMDVIVTGFALASDGARKPEEHFEVSRFRRGIRSWARVLDALAR